LKFVFESEQLLWFGSKCFNLLKLIYFYVESEYMGGIS
jgi:hypothetical protein